MSTFNHVGRSFNPFKYCHRRCLNNPIFWDLGLCAACWAHFMCHHKLSSTSVSQPFFLNSSYGTKQTCQPLRILRNHYAFWVSNTPIRKPVQNVGKLRILRNFGAIRPIPRNLQQLSRLIISRKSPAGQNIDKGLVYFTISIGVRFRHPINKGSCRGETMPNET